jgi:hypothetical protein
MKKAILLMFATLFLSLSMMAQDAAPTPTPSSPAPAAKVEKSHNFFLNKWNTPLFAAQAGAAIYSAKEWNGVLSYYIPEGNQWQSQLHRQYWTTFATMGAVDGLAFGFHKAHFKGHHVVERIVLAIGAGGLVWNGKRNKNAYDKTDCDKGREEGNQFLITHFCRI